MQLGRTLGLETVAEGIEQGWQLERLQSEQCEFGQGFLFSQPIAPEALEALLSLEALVVLRCGVPGDRRKGLRAMESEPRRRAMGVCNPKAG